MKGHRDLEVWQRSMKFVTALYQQTTAFPKRELYGLTNQLRRAAVSVPSNIAEGCGRSSKKEFHQFLSLARGSLLEVETQIEIARDLGYVSENKCGELLANQMKSAECSMVYGHGVKLHEEPAH